MFGIYSLTIEVHRQEKTRKRDNTQNTNIMKEAIVKKDTSVEIIDSPIPKPGPGDVLIKVVIAGKPNHPLVLSS